MLTEMYQFTSSEYNDITQVREAASRLLELFISITTTKDCCAFLGSRN